MNTYKINHVKCCSHTEYGIDVFSKDTLIDSIEKITDNKADIEKLTAICNELEVEPCHIYDLIDDYLTDFKI